MNYDDLDEELIELGTVSADTGSMPYGVDEHMGGLFVASTALTDD
jgi:hypothetical protein